jgi:ABC-2 type transport system permease protein
MAKVLLANLLDNDSELVDWAWNPIRQYQAINLGETLPAASAAEDNCARPGGACESNDLVRYMPSIMTALFFATFMTSSSMLFNSIGIEKENLTIEVLMTSISPRQLLVGKTLGLGAAGLLQTVVWLMAVYFSFNLGEKPLSLPENFEFPVDILIWGMVFFLGGYGLYASLMAGVGACVPKMKAAGVANYIAIFPLFIGYLFGLFARLTHTANSTLIITLSIFPLTSPVLMMMRLTNDTIPVWQPTFSAILLFISGFLALRAAADLFHARNLLSGQPFSLRRYLAALVGSQ